MRIISIIAASALFAGCGPEGDGGKKREIVEPQPVPEVPDADFTGVDAALYESSLGLLLGVSADTVWSAVDLSLADGETGCPDLYIGNPDPNEIDLDDIGEDFAGWSWYDDCTTSSGLQVGGVLLWDANLVASADEKSGDTVFSGERLLAGNAWMGTDTETRVQLLGNMSDAISLRRAPGGTETVESYTLSMDGTVGGSDLFASNEFAPHGWRSTIDLSYTPQSFQMVGSVYLYEQTIANRFDSWVFDLSTDNPDCPSEPNGWMAVRSSDGFWFELDYETPLDYADTDTGMGGGTVPKDDPYAKCDGCGVLYVRGIDQLDKKEVGLLCPDFTGAWAEFVAPAPEAYVYTMR